MLENNVVDYMIKECVANYNLEGAKLIKKSVEDKKVIFVFKRSDLKMSVEFQNDKIANIIYNNFLNDNQRENVTEQEFTERMSEMLEITDIESMSQIDEIANKIIKDINSGKLFGGTIRELLLNSEDREKLSKIKNFFGIEKQLLKLYEEVEELQTAYRNYRNSFYKKDENLIEEIADCFVVALQINKVRIVKNIIRGMVDNSGIFKTEIIEKIIKTVKSKINKMIEKIESGEYGVRAIEYKPTEPQKQVENEGKEQKATNTTNKSSEVAQTQKMSKAEKEQLKKEKKVYEFLKKNSPFYYRSKEMSSNIKIHPTECTRIVEHLLETGEIKISKKGKDGIYGATLEVIQEVEVVV